MRVVDQTRVELGQLFKLNEPPLVPETILRQVLAAFVPYELEALPFLFFQQVFLNFLMPLILRQVRLRGR